MDNVTARCSECGRFLFETSQYSRFGQKQEVVCYECQEKRRWMMARAIRQRPDNPFPRVSHKAWTKIALHLAHSP